MAHENQSVRKVSQKDGTRKSDGSKYYGLWFEGPKHNPFFLTPGQVKTVLALVDDCRDVMRKLPRTPPPAARKA